MVVYLIVFFASAIVVSVAFSLFASGVKNSRREAELRRRFGDGENKRYKKASYYEESGNGRFRMLFDKGANGERLIFNELVPWCEKGGRMLTNLYLPKDDGTTTELDLVLINRAGIFVFESKNYKGWIFGDERSPQWTQTLPVGRGKSEKYRFANPVRQNAGHIAELKKIVPDVPIYSIVVFSNECTFKNVKVSRGDVKVLKLDDVWGTVLEMSEPEKLSEAEIAELYDRLKPLSDVSEEIKAKHVADVREKLDAADGK